MAQKKNRIFVKQEGGRNVDKKLKTRKHSQFAQYTGTDGDPDDYGKDIFNPGSNFGGATIIPRMAPRGGIEGDISNYGRIVLGQRISGDASDGTLRMDEFIPPLDDGGEVGEVLTSDEVTPGMQDNGPTVAASSDTSSMLEVRPSVPEKQEEVIPPEKKQGSAMSAQGKSEQLEDILQSLVTDMEQAEEAVQVEYAPQYAPQLQKPVSKAKVKFKGSFGSFKGSYRHVYVSDEFIVLIYDEDASVFSPPASSDPFTLSYDKTNYAVFFMGIEFDLPCLQGGAQVMIRTE